MISLKLLLTLYGSACLLWSLVLIWYLNKALVSQRQPAWLRTVIAARNMSEVILYGSVMLAPIFIFFIAILTIKKLIEELITGGKK